MDNQSVRWNDNFLLNSVEDNKKVKGLKRYVVVDKNGFIIVVMMAIACVYGTRLLICRYLEELCCNIKVILADIGYRGRTAEMIKIGIYWKLL